LYKRKIGDKDYFYTSVRDKKGKVETVYLGSDKRAAVKKAKSLGLKSKFDGGSGDNNLFTLQRAMMGFVFVFLIFFVFLGMKNLDLVGFVVDEGEVEVEEEVAEELDESVVEILEEEIVEEENSGGGEEPVEEVVDSVPVVGENETEEIVENDTIEIEVNETEEFLNETVEINETKEKKEKKDKTGGVISNLTLVNITSNETGINQTNLTLNVTEVVQVNVSEDRNITDSYSNVTINAPVKWKKRVKLDVETANLTIVLGPGAENVSLIEIENGEEFSLDLDNVYVNDSGVERPIESTNLVTGQAIFNFEVVYYDFVVFFKGFFNNVLTGFAVLEEKEDSVEIILDELVEEVEVEYYLPGPEATEVNVSSSLKRIVVSSDIHYEDVLTYTEIQDVPLGGVKLYWTDNGSRAEQEFVGYDTNDDGLVDYIEWITPSLSNQTYEVEITVLNVQSYPVVGGNWTVEFETVGTADLAVRTIDGTKWSNENESYDLKFLELDCGNESLNYSWINNSVFVGNYSCDDIGYEYSKVITDGAHHLEFQFGEFFAYANNTAFNHSSGGLSAFEKNGTATTPSDTDSQAIEADYTAINGSDDSRWETSLAANDGEIESQIFIFNTTYTNISSLTLVWEGYGETGTGYYTNLSVWNWTGEYWYQTNSTDFTSASDQTIYANITDGPTSFVNSTTNQVAVRITTEKEVAAAACGTGHVDHGDGTCSAVLRPAGTNLSGWGTQFPNSDEHWDKMDEKVPDDDTTYVQQAGPPGTSPWHYARLNVTEYTKVMIVSSSYSNSSFSWSVDWSVADVEAMVAGVCSGSFSCDGLIDKYNLTYPSNIPVDSTIDSLNHYLRAKTICDRFRCTSTATQVYVLINYTLAASPFVYAYDGENYEKISDFVGNADSREEEYLDFIDITKEQKVVDGKVKLKITEEMDEISYVDRIYLRVDGSEVVELSSVENGFDSELVSYSDDEYLVMENGDEYYLEFDYSDDYETLEFAAEGYYLKNIQVEDNSEEEIGVEEKQVMNLKNKILIFAFSILLLALLALFSVKTRFGNRTLNSFSRFVQKIKAIKALALLWIVSFVSITLIRDFLENYIESPGFVVNFLHHLEFSFGWFFVFFLATIFLAIISKDRIENTSKLVTFAWLVTLLPPIIDSIYYYGKEFTMQYVLSNPFANYVSYYGMNAFGYGATLGIKIEIFLVTLLAGLYVASKTRSWMRTIFAMFGVYTITFVYMAIPALYKSLANLFNWTYYLVYPRDLVIIFTALLLILIPIYLAMYGKKNSLGLVNEIKSLFKFKQFKINGRVVSTLFRNLRPYRVIHYVLLVFIGVVLALKYGGFGFEVVNLLHLFFLFLSIMFAWLFAVGVNDIFDVEIDKVSNRNRPLIRKAIDIENYKIFTFLFFVLAILFAGLVSFTAGGLILYFMIAYSFVYSAPPFRFRKYILIPNVIIGLCSLLAVLLGASLVSSEDFLVLPGMISLSVFLLFTFASILKDLKDYEGDKKEGVKTLATVFGLNSAKKIVGVFVGLSFLLIAFVLKIDYLMYVAIPFALLGYLFVVKKNEKWVFVLEFIFIAALIALSLFTGGILLTDISNAQEPVSFSNPHNSIYTDYIALDVGGGGVLATPTDDETSNYVIAGSIDGNLSSGSTSSTTQLINFTHANHTKRLEVIGHFSEGNIDLTDLVIEASEARTAVNTSGISGINTTNHTLFVPVYARQGVYVCPDAEQLEDVHDGCSNVISFTYAEAVAGTWDTGVYAEIQGDYYRFSNVSGSGAGESNVTCGQSITTNVTMANDLNCTGDGLITSTSNLTLDCNGHSITGDDGSGDYGIYGAAGDIVIKNCHVSDFQRGIYQYYGDGKQILNNVVNSSSQYGMMIFGTGNGNELTDVLVDNNTVRDSTTYGILIYTNVSNSNFSNNVVVSSTGDGISMNYGTQENNTFFNNSVELDTDNWEYGFYIIYPTEKFYNLSFINNTVTTSASGQNGFQMYAGSTYRGNFSDLLFDGNIISTSGTSAYAMAFYVSAIPFVEIKNTVIKNSVLNSTLHGGIMYYANTSQDAAPKLYNNYVIDTEINAPGASRDAILFRDYNDSHPSPNNITFLNVTVGSGQIDWVDAGDGFFFRQHYLDVQVNYSNSSPANESNITMWESGGAVELFSELADADGQIARKNITEYNASNDATATNYTPHVVNVTTPHSGYDNDTLGSAHMVGYLLYNVTLNAIAADITDPNATYNTPTPNGTIGGIRWNSLSINVSSDDDVAIANTTIYLYNETNEEFMYNVTEDDSNVFFNFTNMADGNYSYNATTYDTNQNFNYTDRRFIFVDSKGPSFTWEDPTPGDGDVIDYNSSYLNTSLNDYFNTSVFYDWNYSLVGYWSMDYYDGVDVKDNSTFGNDATYGGGSSIGSMVLGKYGSGILLEASTSDVLTVSDPADGSLDLGTDNFSISMWIKPDDLDDNQILGKWESANDRWYMRIDSNSKLQFYNVVGGIARIQMYPTNAVSSTDWMHVVFVSDRDTSNHIYLDGVNISLATNVLYASTIDNAGDFKIGYGTNAYFDGIVDEVQVHKRVLSPEEVNASFNNGAWRLYNNFSGLHDGGIYNYTAYGMDIGGNLVTDSRSVTYSTDASGPNLTYEWPTDPEGSGRAWENIPMNATAVDGSGLYNLTFYLYNISDDYALVSSYNTLTSPNFQNETKYGWGNFSYGAIAHDDYYNPSVLPNRSVFLDPDYPTLGWQGQTPDDESNENVSSVFLNATVSDEFNTSAFFDWNGSLVGYWPMDYYNDTTVFDNSSNSFDANFTEYSSDYYITGGKYGRGANFDDGTGVAIRAGANNSMVSSEGSLEYWMRLNEKQTGTMFHLYEVATEDYIRSHYLASDYIDLVVEDDNVVILNLRYSTTPNTGFWNHYVWTQDGTGIQLYVNGLNVSLTQLEQRSDTWTAHLNPIITNIGGTSSWGFMNATLDEVKLYARALSPAEVNASFNNGAYRLYNNFTDLSGEYDYTSYAIDIGGNLVKDSRNVTIDNAPTIENIDLLPNESYTYTNISCNATPVDDVNLTMTVEYIWYNHSSLDGDGNFIEGGNNTGLSNGTNVTISTLSYTNYSKSDNINCTIRTFDGAGYSGWDGDNITILNSPPEQVTLTLPLDDNVTRNRTPQFIWVAPTDEDGDDLTYNFEIDDDEDAGSGTFLTPAINVTGVATVEYIISTALPVDTDYFWRVRATDGEEYGAYSVDTWNFTVESYLDASLLTDSVDFGTISRDTTYNSSEEAKPDPFQVQNDGNVLFNVTMNSTWLFDLIQEPSWRYQTKCDDRTEPDSFDFGISQIKWTDVTSNKTFLEVVKLLNYTDANDVADIDIQVIVPLDEPFGFKTSNITMEVTFSE